MAPEPENPPRFDAVVLAAGRMKGDPMADALGPGHKCLIPVAGVPMINRVLATLVAAPSVGKIYVCVETRETLDEALADPSAPSDTARIGFLQSRDKASGSVLGVLERSDIARPTLVTTADHALLSVEMVEYFLARSAQSGADLTAGLEHADVLLGAYPHAKRTFLKFADGGYSGCNLFAMMTDDAARAVEFWGRVERERKTPWRLVHAFGLRPLWRYLTGRLTLDGAMREASIALGVEVRAVSMPHTDAAIDVDKPEDLVEVERILSSRKA